MMNILNFEEMHSHPMLSSIFAHVKLPLFPANMTQLLLPQQSIAMDSNQPITTTA